MEAFLDTTGANPCDLGAMNDFIVSSSLKSPFLIVSAGQFVDGIRDPHGNEIEKEIELVMKYLQGCQSRRAVMIADFEGEMPGHGGELVTAAFQETRAVDGDSLSTQLAETHKTPVMGLLIDLRCRAGVAVLKRIMESRQITKLIWGADADLQSLMYQEFPIPLGVQPQAVVDIQLAFSDRSRRLGMQRMLERVPRQFVAGLPAKSQIDFDSFHSKNRRCMPLPLSVTDAMYAMDDLHRIEAILRSQSPPGDSYGQARRSTDITIAETRGDPYGIKGLKSELMWFEKKTGQKKVVKAVEIKRHVLTIRARGPEVGIVGKAERKVDPVLRQAGVTIPADLSFSP